MEQAQINRKQKDNNRMKKMSHQLIQTKMKRNHKMVRNKMRDTKMREKEMTEMEAQNKQKTLRIILTCKFVC